MLCATADRTDGRTAIHLKTTCRLPSSSFRFTFSFRFGLDRWAFSSSPCSTAISMLVPCPVRFPIVSSSHLAAVGAAFASFLADEATAQRRKTGAQASAIASSASWGRGLLLWWVVLHWLLLRWSLLVAAACRILAELLLPSRCRLTMIAVGIAVGRTAAGRTVAGRRRSSPGSTL